MSVPAAGDFVEVRTRRWLVESVTDGDALVRARLACIDDDAQGERLEVLWRDEVDVSIIADSHMSVFASWDRRSRGVFGLPALDPLEHGNCSRQEAPAGAIQSNRTLPDGLGY